MSASRETLLQPTLGEGESQTAAPYSMQAVFFTGFFGGPLATVAIMAVNSVRLRRQLRDLPVLLALTAATLACVWLLTKSPSAPVLNDWLAAQLGQNHERYSRRLLALVFVGAAYLAHRREQRNATLLGLDRPNGWIAGIACAIGGTAVLGTVTHLMS